ncbi:unnamed protein product [Arctia plantaginis]|uniref:Protein cueball n=1 Tax=Arctia plantaginis TaxID=874455 RepID=A0A8S1AJ21_ARCPL|nr:unnamed protein product [Arctia plantaginis]
MFKIQCLLLLAALSEGLARSWDIAVTTGNQLEFYSNNTKTYSEGVQFKDLTALAYDAVHNMLLFADKQNDNASIFSYYLATKKNQALVRRRSYENIHGLAFDPVKGMLFWTDTIDRSIYWISMKPGSTNDLYGNLLITMDDEIPRAIAVDSCRGYIYWTNTNIMKPTIERARFNGTEREVLIDSDIYMPVSIAIDQMTKKIYWADDKEGIHYSIESADLDGKNRKTLLVGTNHRPTALTISKDSVYWVDLDYRTIWRLPKNPPKDAEPIKYIEFTNKMPFGIAANYPIQEQISGHGECENLANLSQNNSAINDSFNVPTDVGLFCVHGTKVNGRSICKCKPGYTGERCDISVCQNYCLQGDCSFTTEGQPKCRCKTGFSGTRCEIDVCQGHCLNHGTCSLDNTSQAVCQCIGDYEGSRCEKLKIVTTTTETVTTIASHESAVPACNCTFEQKEPEPLPKQLEDQEVLNNSRPLPSPSNSVSQMVDEIIPTCDGGWDSVKDSMILALSILVGVLFLLCVYLLTKILQLKKRPRIKKRIIVNKNVTPMTARPDQCEITIENCCNMNICETPCFEPRSTIRPSLLNSKPGKEEKKNLIANMELPDDPY